MKGRATAACSARKVASAIGLPRSSSQNMHAWHCMVCCRALALGRPLLALRNHLQAVVLAVLRESRLHLAAAMEGL